MTQALVVDLLDPELFSSNRFWDVFAWLRANDPVHWHHEPDGPGFWAVTRYRDVTAVYADHESFSSRRDAEARTRGGPGRTGRARTARSSCTSRSC